MPFHKTRRSRERTVYVASVSSGSTLTDKNTHANAFQSTRNISGTFVSTQDALEASADKKFSLIEDSSYLPATRISPIGTFQDGSLKFNNPAKLALAESRVIWPSIRRPDAVLSLGTGTQAGAHSPQATHTGVLYRVGRYFQFSIDAESAWEELLNGLDPEERQDYFRLNFEFPGSEPAIDDIECMDELSTHIQVQPQGPQRRKEVISTLLITCLFFELDEYPVYDAGFFHCRGSIRCRLSGRALIRALLQNHSSTLQYFKDNENLGVSVCEEDICQSCYRYICPVQFTVCAMTDMVTLSVRWNNESRRLSGFCQSMAKVAEDQKLCYPFGSSTHGSPGKVQCSACLPLRLSRRGDNYKGSEKREPTSPVRERSVKRVKRNSSACS
jgi:hypothetical protein